MTGRGDGDTYSANDAYTFAMALCARYGLDARTEKREGGRRIHIVGNDGEKAGTISIQGEGDHYVAASFRPGDWELGGFPQTSKTGTLRDIEAQFVRVGASDPDATERMKALVVSEIRLAAGVRCPEPYTAAAVAEGIMDLVEEDPAVARTALAAALAEAVDPGALRRLHDALASHAAEARAEPPAAPGMR